MRTKTEGLNCFSSYDTIQFYFDFTRKSKIESIQLTFGGFAKCLNDDIKTSVRLYNHGIRQFFRTKVKDGYFKERFLYIDGFSDNFFIIGKGTLFNQIFFYLEETYEKKFVVSYFQTMFDEINDYHKNHNDFEFVKYKNRNAVAEYQDNDSI